MIELIMVEKMVKLALDWHMVNRNLPGKWLGSIFEAVFECLRFIFIIFAQEMSQYEKWHQFGLSWFFS